MVNKISVFPLTPNKGKFIIILWLFLIRRRCFYFSRFNVIKTISWHRHNWVVKLITTQYSVTAIKEKIIPTPVLFQNWEKKERNFVKQVSWTAKVRHKDTNYIKIWLSARMVNRFRKFFEIFFLKWPLSSIKWPLLPQKWPLFPPKWPFFLRNWPWAKVNGPGRLWTVFWAKVDGHGSK